ncbi:MAG: M20/M25/M40 family metallo-hydrolase [Candidatus Bipolaricaulia bacterium]
MREIPDPIELLTRLIRFDTTNPPGREGPCVRYLAEFLDRAGLPTQLLPNEGDRPNLIARLPGCGEAPPLLMYGHVDVVAADSRHWTHPPFEGRVVDGCVWGRGALDMKGAVAMMTSAVLRAKAEGIRPAGDILLAILADEEAGGRHGARLLVERHSDLFDGVRYAIGEFGGVPIYIAGRRFYAIQVTEKQPCWIEATLHGPAGHGARPMRGGTMARLARVLSALDQRRMPIHITPVTRRMLKTVAAHVPWPKGLVLRGLLNARLTDRILSLLGRTGRSLEPLFRNTANATIVRGGEKPNVIPGEITLGIDGRILPDLGVEEFLDELRALIGEPVELSIALHDPAPSKPDYGLFDTLGGVLSRLDPEAVAIPLLLPGSTDARFFSKLGIQTYGFTPMNLPEAFDFFSTIHGSDERIPTEALAFGTDAIFRVIERYGRPKG